MGDGRRTCRGRTGGRARLRYIQRPCPKAHRSDQSRDINAGCSHVAFFSRFKGKCFRCLNKRHRLVECRDPLCCIICKRVGHFGKECAQNPRNGGPGGSARARLGPLPSKAPVRNRLYFPPALESAPMDRFLHCDPARRSRTSNKVIVVSPALEHEE